MQSLETQQAPEPLIKCVWLDYDGATVGWGQIWGDGYTTLHMTNRVHNHTIRADSFPEAFRRLTDLFPGVDWSWVMRNA